MISKYSLLTTSKQWKLLPWKYTIHLVISDQSKSFKNLQAL